MGSVSLKTGDGTARFRQSSVCSSSLNLLMLSSVLTTNLFALYAFTYKPLPSPSSNPHRPSNLSLISSHLSSILREIELSSRKLHQIERDISGYETLDPSLPSLPSELKLFLTPHSLPLGPDSRSKISHMSSSVAHTCARSPDLLSQFMSYKPFSPCPTADSHLPQKLISNLCEPLPRRRCLSISKPRKIWKEDFAERGKSNLLIDEVLRLGGGRIRVGFDIGGEGDFAVKMKERNVTIVTSSLEEGGFRGVFVLQMSVAGRFPFYDGIFDLVRTRSGFEEGKKEGIEFLMFDVDRVLRVGGLFWLDNCVFVDDERKRVVIGVVERFGYRKLKWVVGEKADSKKRIYLSAVLQKLARG